MIISPQISTRSLLKIALRNRGLAQVTRGWDEIVESSRFKPQRGLRKKKSPPQHIICIIIEKWRTSQVLVSLLYLLVDAT